MNTRFYNIRLLTMGGTMDVVPGEVWVEGNRISYAGPSAFMGDANTDAITPPVWDREIDGNGNLLMPGFKNAHTHSAMTFLRSYADDLPLMDWLHTQVFPELADGACFPKRGPACGGRHLLAGHSGYYGVSDQRHDGSF